MAFMTKAVILLWSFIRLCDALYVAHGTPCSSACNSTGGSWWTDLVCSTEDFSATTKGSTLQDCLECTIDSTYVNSSYTDGNSDQFWTLFHMKYVQQHCLIDNTTPHIAAVNACTSACVPLTNTLKTLWISEHPFVGQYDYCTVDSSAYTSHAVDCARCLQAQEESVIIGNFVDTMKSACDARPFAASGDLIVPARALFDTSTFVATAATSGTASSSATATTSTSTVTSSQSILADQTTATGAAISTSSSATTDSVSSNNSGGLSTGAAAGIGVGITVVVLAVLAGLGFLFMRRRRSARAGKPQLPAVELSLDGKPALYQELNGSAYVHEKPAGQNDGQLHEAPDRGHGRFAELLADDRNG